MIKGQFGPAARIMAFLTFLAIATIMHVIDFVTGDTVLAGPGIAVSRMAAGTAGGFMFTCKRKGGFFMSITAFKPAIGSVATVAGFGQFFQVSGIVRALLAVTRIAGAWCITKFLLW